MIIYSYKILNNQLLKFLFIFAQKKSFFLFKMGLLKKIEINLLNNFNDLKTRY